MQEKRAQEAEEKIEEAEVKQAKEDAEKSVEKVQKKAEEAVTKVVTQKEAAPGGIVDIVTSVLAKHAKVQKDKNEKRSEIETIVKTRSTARDAAVSTARVSLTKGIDVTRDITAEQSKKELEEVAKAPLAALKSITKKVKKAEVEKE